MSILLFLRLPCCLSLRFMNIRMAVNLWSLVTLAWLQLSTGLSILCAAHPLMLHQRSLLRQGESKKKKSIYPSHSLWLVSLAPSQMCVWSSTWCLPSTDTASRLTSGQLVSSRTFCSVAFLHSVGMHLCSWIRTNQTLHADITVF